jgi:MYXO-CTERM domain-containing protein
MGRTRAAAAIASIVLAAVLGAARPSRACSIPGPTPHTIDPQRQATDHQAPTLPAPPPPKITRGRAAHRAGCSSSANDSCDDVGLIDIALGATDDMSQPSAIGYRFSLVSGKLPDGLQLPADAVRPGTGSSVVLAWIDEMTDTQEPFDFTVQIVAVDEAGNESAPQTLRVQDPGTSGGCRVGDGRAGGAVLALALLALAAPRRRRR